MPAARLDHNSCNVCVCASCCCVLNMLAVHIKEKMLLISSEGLALCSLWMEEPALCFKEGS